MPVSKRKFSSNSLEYSTGVGISSFASVIHFDNHENEERGELYVVSVIHSPDAQISKEVKSLIQERYYLHNGKSAFVALSSSFGEIVHLLRQRQINIEIAGISIVDGVAYLVSANGSKIFLIRGGSQNEILSSNESEIKPASGYLREGDILLIGTSDLFEIVNNERLKTILDEVNDVEELKEYLVDETAGNKKPISFCILEINEEIQEVEQAETLPVQEVSSYPKPNSARLKIARAIDRIIRLIPEKQVVINQDPTLDVTNKPAKSKLPMLVGIGLLLALLVSIWFGVRARDAQNKRAEYEDELQTAQHQFQEAQSLTGIDSARAKELILSARDTVNTLKQRGIEDQELNVLGASIEQNLGGIAGIFTQSPITFLDLTIIRADFQGSDLSYSDGVIRVLDTENKRMTLINASTKNTENIGDLDLLPNAKQTTAYADESFILSSDGIREVQNELELVVRDEKWNDANSLIGAFGGNLYVLDKDNNKIWRFPKGVNSYGEGQEWFAPGITVHVTDAVSWAIDGKVWIMYEDGEVDVYERGLPQRFVPQGLSSTVGLSKIFTDENAENVYLLDTEVGRIIVLSKTGEYKGEYQSSELKNAIDFIVSEPDSKIVFLSNNKLWEIAL